MDDKKRVEHERLQATGRYTVNQALDVLFENVEVFGRQDEPKKTILLNISVGAIPVYKPGSSARIFKPKSINENYEEVEWDDLNKFIPYMGILSSWRFPAPSTQEVQKHENNAGFNSCGWKLKPLDRQDTLRSEIYRKLKKAYLANEHVPSPANLISQWKEERPAEFYEVTAEYVKFYGRDGDGKAVDIKGIGARISRLIVKKQRSFCDKYSINPC